MQLLWGLGVEGGSIFMAEVSVDTDPCDICYKEELMSDVLEETMQTTLLLPDFNIIDSREVAEGHLQNFAIRPHDLQINYT